MTPIRELRQLLTSRSTGALGTLHDGAPYVSMVPFVLLPDPPIFIIHVSQLAAHTRDMLANPRVSLLIAEAEQANLSPQALPRVTILGPARQLSSVTTEYAAAKAAYLSRFPDAASLFNLGDFSLFTITPTEVRWVAGFSQARTLTPGSFSKALAGD
jgi:heme iron utilization protein